MIAAVAFAATNLDDILVLTLLFSRADDRRGRLRIALGQFLGMGILTITATFCGLGLASVSDRFLRLLGLIPIWLAFRVWRGREDEDGVPAAAGVLATAGLTLANGGDNLGVYIPLFAGFSPEALAVTATVFFLLCGLWCLLASVLAGLPAVQRCIERYKRLLVPIVFLLLGLRILFRA